MSNSDKDDIAEEPQEKKKMGFLSRNAKRAMYSPTAQRHRATEDALLGDPEAAIEEYNEYLELWPKDAEVIAIKAHVTSLMDEDEEALDIYDESLEIDPKRAWTWFEKASLLEEMERYSEAVMCYHKALEHTKEGFRNEMKNRPDPPKAEILGALAHAYFHAGTDDDLRLADKYSEEALEIDGDELDALRTKVHLLEKQGKWEQVLDLCEDVLVKYEDHEGFLEDKAEAHLKLNEPDEVFDSLTKLLVQDYSNADTWFLFARYYAMIKKNKDAIDKLTVAIHLDPELQEKLNLKEYTEFEELDETDEYRRLMKIDIFDPC